MDGTGLGSCPLAVFDAFCHQGFSHFARGILEKLVFEWDVDGTGSGSYPVAVFSTSDVEPTGSSATEC